MGVETSLSPFENPPKKIPPAMEKADGWKISAEILSRHIRVIFLMTNKTKFFIKT